MKITLKSDPVFQPKTIEITFESQKELNAFGAIMNYPLFTDALEKAGGIDTACIRSVIEDAGGRVSGEPHQQIVSIVEKHPLFKK